MRNKFKNKEIRLLELLAKLNNSVNDLPFYIKLSILNRHIISSFENEFLIKRQNSLTLMINVELKTNGEQ